MGQPGMTIHRFNQDLNYSSKASDEMFWDAVYRKAFPNIVSHMMCGGDVASQRMGIDRSILLSNGKTLYVEEKKRREDYPDILLEYISVDTSGAPGWIEKDLAIDYLAYAFMKSKKCYLFPWPMLRRAWIHLGAGWKDKYKIVKAQNDGYCTWSVAVPALTLLRWISTASIIEL